MSWNVWLIAGAALLAVAVPVLVYALVPERARATGAPARPSVAFRPAVPAAAAGAAGAGRGPFAWIAPFGIAERIERDLELAGLQSRWPLARVLRLKALLTIGAAALGVLLVATGPGLLRVLLAVALVLVGYLAVDAVVSGRARERQERIRHDLADALDQITISIEAGLGLETAVARVGQFGRGPLAEEFTRTVQDMRLGLTRREAYLALAARTDVTDLRRFARAIMQADQYGVSIGNVVRTQAKELRAKRRQRAEERAMKVPVKILFPLMFSILPVLFIVVLAPGIINLVGVLGSVR